MTNCKKCGAAKGTILLRQKDLYCQDCFIISVNHKFRACIGKNKILTRNENVLIGLSGGLGSTILLDLIRNGIALNNHKKLWITPLFFHVIDIDEDSTVATSIIQQCNTWNYDLSVIHISEYILENKNNKPTVNNIPKIDKEAVEQFRQLINSMPSSSQNDCLTKIKRELFVGYARRLHCNTVFTAETASTLAVNLLSNLSLGRGSQVQYDVGFCDSRNQVKILRPMKDITHEELRHYMTINRLTLVKQQSIYGNSLQSAIQCFINDLQDNFPSTIPTVCKTAEKIGVQDNDTYSSKCLMCESSLNEVRCKLTALEATNLSRTVSMNYQKGTSVGDSINQNSLFLFPHINKCLCYTCSKNYLEMRQTTLPLHIKKILSSN